MAIDPNGLQRDSETLRKIVVDLAEQLDRSLAEQKKYQPASRTAGGTTQPQERATVEACGILMSHRRSRKSPTRCRAKSRVSPPKPRQLSLNTEPAAGHCDFDFRPVLDPNLFTSNPGLLWALDFTYNIAWTTEIGAMKPEVPAGTSIAPTAVVLHNYDIRW